MSRLYNCDRIVPKCLRCYPPKDLSIELKGKQQSRGGIETALDKRIYTCYDAKTAKPWWHRNSTLRAALRKGPEHPVLYRWVSGDLTFSEGEEAIRLLAFSVSTPAARWRVLEITEPGMTEVESAQWLFMGIWR